MSEEEQQRNNETKDDEEMRKLLRPSPDEDKIVSLLKQHYCTDNETIQFLKKLDSYDDYNCLVSLNNEKYLCKVNLNFLTHNMFTINIYLKMNFLF